MTNQDGELASSRSKRENLRALVLCVRDYFSVPAAIVVEEFRVVHGDGAVRENQHDFIVAEVYLGEVNLVHVKASGV